MHLSNCCSPEDIYLLRASNNLENTIMATFLLHNTIMLMSDLSFDCKCEGSGGRR